MEESETTSQGSAGQRHRDNKTDVMEDRPVARCTSCHLNQFYTQLGTCRRCGERLPGLASPEIVEERPEASPRYNLEAVVRLGRRIAYIRREGLCVTQSGLLRIVRGRISRSYLCRVESGSQTLSLGKLEILADGMDVPVRRFLSNSKFSEMDLLCLDPWIMEIATLLREHPFTPTRLQQISEHLRKGFEDRLTVRAYVQAKQRRK